MKVLHDVGHVPGQEHAVCSHGVSAQRSLAGIRDPLLDVFKDLRFCLGHGLAMGKLVQKFGAGVHVPHEVVHLFQRGVVRLDDDVHAVAQNVELGIRHQRGDLYQGVVREIQAGHFAVDPDDAFISNRHAPSLSLSGFQVLRWYDF
ncbi:hypothetical protein D3C73_1200120 [compost metagenome]